MEKNSLDRVAKDLYTPEGIITLIIPYDPDELIERMDLLFAEKEAGNTGLDQKLKEIVKALYKKKMIVKNQLKNLNDKANY